jgi:hypothetical protein
MPVVKANILKANQAAFLVSAWLGKQCLVRPVSEGTDVGVDLFCETIDAPSEQPFLHFWVQVKTGATQITVTGEQAKCSFDKEHVDYWCRQPVPAYAFLVPEDQLTNFQKVFIISFVRKRLMDEVPFDSNSKTLASDFVCSASELSEFADTNVRLDYMMMQIFRGVSEMWPVLRPQYIRRTMSGFRAGFGSAVADQVRHSASATMMDILRMPAQRRRPEHDRQLAVLAGVLRPFTEGVQPNGYWEEHYEDYWVVGLYLKRSGDAQAARVLLERAIQIIEGDEHFKAQVPHWGAIVNEIRADIGN